jgi:tRNA 2-thiouridine synthesizing protein A
MELETSEVYDLRGLNCPLPVLKIRKRLSETRAGSLLVAETTDALAVIDVPHFCREYGHEMIACDKVDGGHRFTIRNGAAG